MTVQSTYCPCDWKNLLQSNSGLIMLTKLVISIVGVACTIFLQSYGGAVAFALLGATVAWDLYNQGDKEIVDLTQKMQHAEQQLRHKQENIGTLTKQLTEMEKSSRAAHEQFQKEIAQFKGHNEALQQGVENLHKQQEELVKENRLLAETNQKSGLQIAKISQHSTSLERKIQSFIEHNQQLIPQVDRLAAVSSQLQTSEQRFRETVQSIDHRFDADLRALSVVFQGMVTKNLGLSQQIKSLEAEIRAGQKATNQLILELQNHQASKQQVNEDRVARENTISLQTASLQALLVQLQQERMARQQNGH